MNFSIKKIAKNALQYYRKSANVRRFHNTMLEKVRTADVEIEELTASEKTEISNFWGKFGLKPDYDAFKWFYSVNGQKDPRYISEDIYTNYIWTTLNDMTRCKGLNDKNMLDVFYSGYNMPETIFRNINGEYLDKDYQIISRDKAISLTEGHDKVVIKEAIDSCQGLGVICVEGKDCDRALNGFKKDYIVQKVVKQHPSFAQLNQSSVNIVRMTSLLLNGEVHVLDSIIRVGAPGNFTDQAHGGGSENKNIAIGINSDGILKKYGVTAEGRKVTKLLNGYAFGGHRLIGYNEMVELAKALHARTPQARLIGWDLVTDMEGNIVIIEANMTFPGIVKGQDCNGPFFGDLTEDVLNYVLGQRNI